MLRVKVPVQVCAVNALHNTSDDAPILIVEMKDLAGINSIISNAFRLWLDKVVEATLNTFCL